MPSWNDGATRSALLAFLKAAEELAPEDRVAVFDNDGTLWCERPRYAQFDFFVWHLRQRVRQSPELLGYPAFAAVLSGGMAAVADEGLDRVVAALLGLFEGMEPEEFDSRVNAFLDDATHPDRGLRYDQMVYQPMLELLSELDRRGFTNCIVSGGGTEFVRAMSRRVYGVP
ncbi:HAD family hydrolase, partial [Demequina sp.]|uniref:haloacid dehalogenase-like hydrolase n=1 Tax=Demequina sp. TaxID=2050685 RepID=UPI0025F18F5E